MPDYTQSKISGASAARVLIDPISGRARDRFQSVMLMHHVLTSELGFRLRENQTFGPPGGRQLIYVGSDAAGDHDYQVIVRIKTRGNGQGKRVGEPHMAISIVQGGMGWDAERAKFTAQGTVSPKLIAPEGQAAYSPFTMIMGGRYDGPDQDTWANACHFNLPPGFNDAGAAGLTPEA